jgi:hypothetical protein
VRHCDVDLGNIKQEYEKKFCRSLQADVAVYLNIFISSTIYVLISFI